MPSLSRRDALRAGVGVAASVGLAGCSTGPELAEFRLLSVRLMNTHEEPHSGTVLVVEDGEPIYRSTIDADGADDPYVGGGAFEDLPTEPGRYELYGWHRNAATDEWSHLSFDADPLSTDGVSCVDVMLRIEPDPEAGVRSFFLRSLGCDEND